MVAFVLSILKSFVTEEILREVFHEVILKTTVEIVGDFAKDSANPYDDKLVAHFREYLDSQPRG
jgi:hypothetical protein